MRQLATIMLAGVALAGVCAAEPIQKLRETTIDADELNTKYQVRGPLGISLGEVLTVVGETVVSRTKDADPKFQVDEINGRSLVRPVTMRYRLLNGTHLKTGKKYQLRAYQSGGYEGIPAEAVDDSGAAQSPPYRFIVRLIVIKQQNLAEP